jgi:DNA replication and repair protein RecF
VWIKSIRYHNFRNIDDIEVLLEPGLNILFGDNGQGKTNFIEGVHLCLTGETFRFGDNLDLIKTGEDQTSVSLLAESKMLDEIKFTIDKGRKSHLVNGKKISSHQLSTQYPVVLFSPESLNSVKEGSSERRDLVDQFLLMCPDLNYQRLFDDYSKILKSKNKILKSYVNKMISKEQAIHLLESYEKTFLNLATDLTNKRIQGLRALIEDFKNSAALLYQKPVDISVEYLISEINAMHYDTEKILDVIKIRLYELKTTEMAVGHSLVGPQKHDINFLVNNTSSRIFCSQGQQRTLILAFKLAQMMYHSRVYGIVPVLFLDDVLSELDGATRANLVKLLNGMEGQIFITTTDKYLCRDLTGQQQKFVSVSSGRFSFL